MRALISSVLIVCFMLNPRHTTARQAGSAVGDQRELLERLAGHWVARGAIGKAQTTHDIDAHWVLNKEYLQIHEISRERDAKGTAQYEAIIHVAWNPKLGEYACLWLDSTDIASFPPEGVGHAPRDGDRIPFVFKDPEGGIRTTFAYDRANDRWAWNIDNDVKGTLTPFARLTLTRR